jgi:hypothetical protein
MSDRKKNFLFKLLANPKLGKSTYWGNFQIEHQNINEVKKNITNRNNLYHEYSIIKNLSCDKVPRKLFKFFEIKDYIHFEYGSYDSGKSKMRCDHKEYYKTKDNEYIFLFSNYHYTEDKIKILLDNEYIEIPPIYFNCRTFMKIF